MKRLNADFLIVGAGIVGLALAYQLKKYLPQRSIIIIEKEQQLGFHSSGRNSGVLHAGFYYHPDSLKAKFTRAGNQELTKFCLEKGLKINRCGKVVVAKNESQLETLFELKRRGDINGVELYIIDEKELKDLEPNARTFQYAIWSPNTSVVDPKEVLNSLRDELRFQDVSLIYDAPYSARIDKNAIVAGDYIIEYSMLINAAGLYADTIAKDFGLAEDYVLLPFKGLYLYYEGEDMVVRRNIYPVPDIRNPFLGVHYTVTVDNKVKIGPTASPSFWRENYNFTERFNIREFTEVLKWNSKMFIKSPLFRRTALSEIRKYIKSNLIKDASSLVHSVGDRSKYVWGKPGIRSQLLNIRTLELVQDFVVQQEDNSVHILNAVSPAFTASFPFTRFVIEKYILKEVSDGQVQKV